MHEDELNTRMRASWLATPTPEPDIGTIRRRGRRKALVRGMGVAFMTVALAAGVAIPVWQLAGLGSSKGGTEVLDGQATSSVQPSTAEGSVLADSVAGGVMCIDAGFGDDGDRRIAVGSVPIDGDPIAGCAAQLGVEPGAVSLCAASGYVQISTSPECEGTAITALPEDLDEAVALVEEARRRILDRYPEGGTPCFDHEEIRVGAAEIPRTSDSRGGRSSTAGSPMARPVRGRPTGTSRSSSSRSRTSRTQEIVGSDPQGVAVHSKLFLGASTAISCRCGALRRPGGRHG